MNDRRAFIGLIGAATAGTLLFGRPTKAAAELRFTVNRSPADWKRVLGPQRFYILRQAGTERAFTSPLLNEHRKGIFACAGCDLPVYPSETKFDSGTGWPSFWQEIANGIGKTEDRSLGMTRTEVHCRRCGGHLGHVFDDGPPPTGLRYCMNGVALKFTPSAAT